MSATTVQPISAADYQVLVAKRMSESTFQTQVLAVAATLGYTRRYHTHDSRHSPAGFPDLVLVNPQLRRVVWRELKVQSLSRGKVSTAQQQWLDDLTAAGQDAGVWRPLDLLQGRIREQLLATAAVPA